MTRQARVLTPENYRKVKGEAKRTVDAANNAGTTAEKRWAKSKGVIYPSGHKLHTP